MTIGAPQEYKRKIDNVLKKTALIDQSFQQIPEIRPETIGKTISQFTTRVGQLTNTQLDIDSGDGFLPNGLNIDLWEIIARG